VIRRIALLVAALAASPLTAPCAPAAQADLSAENIEQVNGETILRGKAQLTDAGLVLTADEIRINQENQQAVATGSVTLTQVGDRLLADQLTYNRAQGTFSATGLRIGKFPFYIEGRTAEGHVKIGTREIEVTIHDATVSYGEPGAWQPTVKAKTITYSPGRYLRMKSADLGIGKYQPFPVRTMGQDLVHRTGLETITVDGGYRHDLGPYLGAAMHYPIVDGFSAGPSADLYTYRGLMLGPVANYDVEHGGDTMLGSLRTGYIYDYGNRLTDIDNNPVPPNRAFVEWRHIEQVGPDLTINGNVTWSSDSEVIRDFHPKEFVPVQEPDNFVEAVYTSGDFFGSFITRFQPDSFYPVQERLPEIRFDLVPTLVGGGVYVRIGAGLARLEENPPSGGAHLASNRFDAFLGITRPLSYKGIIDVTPVLGGRYTEYWDTAGSAQAGGTGRALAEFGVDMDLKLSGTWDYKNPLLDIDGIRHLVTPSLSYRYIPDAAKDAAWIPPIDRETFSTYLPVLELGDMRALDQLQAENVLRVGLSNTIQTRDKTYGSRDLLALDLEDDIRYQRAPDEPDYSDIYAELRATPTKWLELRFEDSLSSTHAEQRSRDATITFRQGELWSVGFGLGYLSDQYVKYFLPGLGSFPVEGLNTYHAEVRMRINEQYEAFARGDYDYFARRFVDQFYGVDQRLANTWLIEYAVVFSNGPNKGQGHFGLNVSLNLIRF
jgi:LPS-assembly protein